MQWMLRRMQQSSKLKMYFDVINPFEEKCLKNNSSKIKVVKYVNEVGNRS